MLGGYWPDRDRVESCIRTEAEELDSNVLRVVHEPMRLSKWNINTGEKEFISEDAESALLDHLKRYSRPIPILGDAGSGKSHLVRLLDIKLGDDPETKDWIVKRIPKSSSLRQVLEILLKDIEGENFDSIRNNIKEVGSKLETEQVVDYLVVFIKHRLRELLKSTTDKIESIKNSGGKVSEMDKKRLLLIKQHAPDGNLPALLSDPSFQERITSPGRCLYNIAKRLTIGGTDDEIAENNYTLTESDIDFSSLVIGDLSNLTQSYIATQRLTTSEEKRKEVIALLNEVLTDACRKSFQHSFNLNSSQFQDIFDEIRKKLVGKTLVILVEDMAAITAIENDLIDSLLKEDRRDGEQVLCTVKSAIAVTTNYEGYLRRRDTIATRSGSVEWHIEIRSENQDEIYQRVENLCGRYLNAARYGLPGINEFIENNSLPLKPWHDDYLDDNDREALNSFGFSVQGYSLFPYNRSSLRALIDANCLNPSGDLEFNPRVVIGAILINILSEFRGMFLDGLFPPENFMRLTSSSNLQGQLRINNQLKLHQSLAAVAFWGHGSTDKGELVNSMPPAIAAVMGLDELAKILGDTSPSVSTAPAVSTASAVSTTPAASTSPAVSAMPEAPPVSNDHDVNQIVDKAFNGRNISQDLAKKIRNELFDVLKSELKYAKKWSGVSFDVISHIKSRMPLIYVPFINNNPPKCYAYFGDEKTLSDNVAGLKFRRFVSAFLKRDKREGWSEGLYEDYCHYINFSKQWADSNIPDIIRKLQDENLRDNLSKSVSSVMVVRPEYSSSSTTVKEKIDILVSHSKEWADRSSSKTKLDDWDSYKNAMIERWDSDRKNWIRYVSCNNHAISRDILTSSMRGITARSPDRLLPQKAHKHFSKIYFDIFSPLSGCSSKEEFVCVFRAMADVISKMSKNGRFDTEDGFLSSRQLINRVEKILSNESDSQYWLVTNKILKIKGEFNEKIFFGAIHQLDGGYIDLIDEVLSNWKVLCAINVNKFKSINRENNSQSKVILESEIIKTIGSWREDISSLISSEMEGKNESS